MMILAVIGIVILVALSIYTLNLLKKLKQQNALIQQAKENRLVKLKESIEIIAQAMKTGECNHSEGVIRLAMLLMPLGKTLQDYPAMAKLHGVVRDMPTHEARKELQKKERMRLDLARESAEAELEDEIKMELAQLLLAIKEVKEL